jgi:hypothetical protein
METLFKQTSQFFIQNFSNTTLAETFQLMLINKFSDFSTAVNNDSCKYY